MPGGDRTGPMGMGPMTGRQAGYCTGGTVPGFASAPGGAGRAFGRGFGGGFGGGGRGRRGRRNQFYATGLTGWQRAEAGMPVYGGSQEAPAVSPETTFEVHTQQTLDLLKSEAKRQGDALDQINQRIAGLEAELQQR